MIEVIRVPKIKYTPFRNNKDLIEEYCADKGLEYEVVRSAFTLYVAHYILSRVKKAVKEQKIGSYKMRSKYKRLSPRYRKSKPWGTKTKFWINSGQLINKLGVYVDTKREVYIGFRGNVRYINSKSKVKFKVVLMVMEYGSKKKNIPARPLIRPITKLVRKNITWLWDRFKKQVLSGELEL